MRDLLTAETTKATTGRYWIWLLLGGLALSVITVLSLVTLAEDGIAAGSATNATVTDDVVRYWMTMHLFAALFGALFVTREYAGGTVVRTVLLAGGDRRGVLLAKLLAATVMGLALAAVATAFAAAAPWVIMPAYGLEPEWTATTTRVLAGVFTVTVLSAPWGVCIGWITHHQVAAVAFLVLTTLAVEPYLADIVPALGKYLLTIAMGSVYLDTKSYLLPVPAALAVIGGWLLLAWLLADRLVRRRDVP